IGADPRTDIALIKIDAKNLPALDMSAPPGVKQGEWVVAIGSPFGFENSISAGIVSGVHRALPGGQMTPFIQTDVAVNPGNSGGPLVGTVEKNSPAEKAGVKTGDVIRKIDGIAMNDSTDVTSRIGNTAPGTKIALELWRDGKPVNVAVTVGTFDQEKVAKDDSN